MFLNLNILFYKCNGEYDSNFNSTENNNSNQLNSNVSNKNNYNSLNNNSEKIENNPFSSSNFNSNDSKKELSTNNSDYNSKKELSTNSSDYNWMENSTKTKEKSKDSYFSCETENNTNQKSENSSNLNNNVEQIKSINSENNLNNNDFNKKESNIQEINQQKPNSENSKIDIHNNNENYQTLRLKIFEKRQIKRMLNYSPKDMDFISHKDLAEDIFMIQNFLQKTLEKEEKLEKITLLMDHIMDQISEIDSNNTNPQIQKLKKDLIKLENEINIIANN